MLMFTKCTGPTLPSIANREDRDWAGWLREQSVSSGKFDDIGESSHCQNLLAGPCVSGDGVG